MVESPARYTLGVDRWTSEVWMGSIGVAPTTATIAANHMLERDFMVVFFIERSSN